MSKGLNPFLPDPAWAFEPKLILPGARFLDGVHDDIRYYCDMPGAEPCCLQPSAPAGAERKIRQIFVTAFAGCIDPDRKTCSRRGDAGETARRGSERCFCELMSAKRDVRQRTKIRRSVHSRRRPAPRPVSPDS
jgi:hypothetical protein